MTATKGQLQIKKWMVQLENMTLIPPLALNRSACMTIMPYYTKSTIPVPYNKPTATAMLQVIIFFIK